MIITITKIIDSLHKMCLLGYSSRNRDSYSRYRIKILKSCLLTTLISGNRAAVLKIKILTNSNTIDFNPEMKKIERSSQSVSWFNKSKLNKHKINWFLKI